MKPSIRNPERKASAKPVFFATAADFRAWLEANAGTAAELTVGYYKVGSGRPSLTWPESVDEALCVGWIDSIRRRIDDEAYQIRFTPRRCGSIWSAVNLRRVEALKAEGRLKPAGLRAFEKRVEGRSKVYAYEQRKNLRLAPEEVGVFKKNKAAWDYFETVAPSYRQVMVYWVLSARQPAVRARRLAKFIEACGAGVKLLK